MRFEKIENICTIVRGSSPRPQGDKRYYSGNIPRLMIADVTRDGMYVIPKIDSLTIEGAKLSRPMKKGDLIIAVSGDAGLPCVLNIDACIHDGFVGLRNLDETKIDKIYLYQFLKAFKVRNKAQAVGAIFKNLTTLQIKDIEVPLPSLPTQKKIVEILEAADMLRQKDKALIEKYHQLSQSLFLDMFGDPVKNEKGWKTERLDALAILKSGGTPTRQNPEYFKGSIPWITTVALGKRYINNDDAVEYITDEALENSTTKLISKGAIMIGTRVGVGKASIINCDMCSNQDITSIVLSSNKISIQYLFENFGYYMKYFESQKRGATIQGITSETIKGLNIIIPPITLQNKFALIIEQIEKQKQLAEQNLIYSEALFNSLLQKAFNGELVTDDAEMKTNKKQTSLV
jgi:type I restriction enzyme S subunit